MVLTIEKLHVQVQELQKQYNGLLNSLGSNMINYIFEYQRNMQHVQAKIDLINEQINDLTKEEKIVKKEEKNNKDEE